MNELSPLSPAAQAVMKAAASAYWEEQYEVASPSVIAAAALRAVADQVVPVPTNQDLDRFDFARTHAQCEVRGQILAIAAELATDHSPSNTDTIAS